MSTVTTAAKSAAKEVKISDIQGLLKKGFTRLKKKDAGYGSIQEHYGLTASQVAEIFANPKLKGLKVKFPTVSVVDDVPDAAPKATAEAEPEVELFK